MRVTCCESGGYRTKCEKKAEGEQVNSGTGEQVKWEWDG